MVCVFLYASMRNLVGKCCQTLQMKNFGNENADARIPEVLHSYASFRIHTFKKLFQISLVEHICNHLSSSKWVLEPTISSELQQNV